MNAAKLLNIEMWQARITEICKRRIIDMLCNTNTAFVDLVYDIYY